MYLINGDCLEVMKDFSNNSIDLLFCDLPYGQTSCKWDSLIDLELFWKEVNRICKDTTPMFFTCSTKFGVSLINSNPKNFRYDLVWVKSAPCGFLNAKKMPMKKHEMIYVFYKKLPLYDLSSHKNKFLKEGK
jgi:DNA modification methylase